MNFSRVIDDEICYHSKEVYNLYQMYHTRYSLFKQVGAGAWVGVPQPAPRAGVCCCCCFHAAGVDR